MSLARRSALLSCDAATLSRTRNAQLEAQIERELDKLRARVAAGIAARAVHQAEAEALEHGSSSVHAGVVVLLDRGEQAPLLRHVVRRLVGYCASSSSDRQRSCSEFLFAVAAGPLHKPRWPLTLVSSSPRLLAHAEAYLSLRFLNRLSQKNTSQEDDRFHTCAMTVADSGAGAHDELLLWDTVRKASHFLQPAKDPPPGSVSASSLLALARMRLERLTPEEALSELQSPDLPLPAILVDIRPASERQAHCRIACAVEIERCTLEWAFDPRSTEGERHTLAGRYDLRVIVLDGDGRASSLAAVALHDLGLLNATDVVGGFASWKAAGLPTCA